jgi:hypothetical protein
MSYEVISLLRLGVSAAFLWLAVARVRRWRSRR